MKKCFNSHLFYLCTSTEANLSMSHVTQWTLQLKLFCSCLIFIYLQSYAHIIASNGVSQQYVQQYDQSFIHQAKKLKCYDKGDVCNM